MQLASATAAIAMADWAALRKQVFSEEKNQKTETSANRPGVVIL